MMLARIILFLIGAGLGAGGGYLAWTHRAGLDRLFPPGADGLPLMLIAGMGALSLGIVFLASAMAPRPKRTARLQEAAARRAEKLRAADSYYAERSRAADRDWRSGKLPPHAEPADPLFDREPARGAEPAPQDDPLFDPPGEAERETRTVHTPTEPAPRSIAGKPVATSIPPTALVFASTATLSPIPRGSDPPPHPLAAAPAPAPAHAGVAAMPSTAAAAPARLPPEDTEAFADIRAAIAAGRLEEADRLLNATRETATGLALAELTGLAGDHAAAAGRESNAKWLWRLALKRFGEEGALDSAAARKVSERLRLAGQ